MPGLTISTVEIQIKTFLWNHFKKNFDDSSIVAGTNKIVRKIARKENLSSTY